MQVFGGTRPLIYSMCPVRIFHKLKGLVIFHKLIYQHFCIIEMYIVVPSAMNI